jgi:plastocyanin
MLGAGGVVAAGLLAKTVVGRSETPVEIRMRGNADGSRVGFDPVGLHVQPGTMVRWLNVDAGNAHTATAYHPKLMDRPRRIPESAEPWDSDYLLPEDSFSVTLTVPGVYDFYCVPHEHAGMVGRIVVGKPGNEWRDYPFEIDGGMPLPEIALGGFPSVDEMMRAGSVSPP